MSGVLGLVLAGGRSTRFGADKASALLHGRPLLAHVAEALRPAATRLAVAAARASDAGRLAAALGLPVVEDAPDHAAGPLAGVAAGLALAAAEGCDRVVTAPCDAPWLTPAVIDRLLAEGGAAVARSPRGVEPLIAVWPTAHAEAVRRALTGGAHPPVRRLLAELGAVEVAFDDPTPFRNANTPADLTA